MQDDFEHKLSQRMQEFSISPQPEIWQRVEAALPEKRSRRIAFWWWLLPLVVGAGLGIWWLSNRQQVNTSTPIVQQEKHIQKSIPANTKNSYPSVDDFTDSTTETKPITTQSKPGVNNIQTSDTAANNSSNTPIIKNQVLLTNSRQVKVKSKIVQGSTNALSKDKLSVNKKNVEVAYGNAVVINSLVKNDPVFQSNTQMQEPTIEKADSNNANSAVIISQSSDTAIAQSIITTPKDTTEKNTAVKKQAGQKNITKKVTWLADFTMGSSWLQGTNSLDKSAVRNYDLAYASPGNGVGSGIGSSISARFIKPSANFSFRFGVVRRQAFSQHFGWQMALHYQLLSTRQHIGQSIDSFASGARSSSQMSRYRTGINGTYKNVVHQLQFAPGIGYCIRSASHSPIIISTGFSAAYNINSNLLLHDYKNSVYLRYRKASAQMQYGGYIGIDAFVQKKIQLGLLYQHSFSNVAKADLGSDYQWRQLQLHVGLPISK